MSQQNETLAQKASNEYRALKRLRKSNPGLFTILILSVLFFGALWLYDKLWGIPVLEQEVLKSKQEIQLLETQLIPFKTIALEKYPGKLGEALSKLAEDIQKFETELRRSERRIKSLVVDIELDLEASWKNGKLPDLSNAIRIGADDPKLVDVDFTFEDSSQALVEFYGCTKLKYIEKEKGITTVSYSALAHSGSPIFGKLSESIQKAKKLKFNGRVTRDMLADTNFKVHGFRAIFSVNGVPSFNVTVNQTIDANLNSPDSKSLQVFLEQEVDVNHL